MTPLWRRLLPVFWGVLALNAAVFLAWTLPQTALHRSIAARAEVVREEERVERQRLSELQARADTIVGNDADVKRFFARLGDKSSLSEVREDLARAARDAGVKLGGIQYRASAVKGAEGLARFDMTMPVEGRYRQIAAFLDRLERLPRLVVVEQVQLQSRGRDDAGAGELEIALAAYFRGEEGDAVAR